jgi:hypothetical protein
MTGFMTVVIGMSGTKLRTPVPTFTSAVPTTVTFTWPAIDNATYYEYYTSASGSATSPTALAAGVRTKDITVASGNTSVTFNVRAVGPVIYEKSEYGSIVGLSTKGTLPTPTSLSGASTTTTRVTFTWAAGTPAPFDANWTYSYYTVINGTTSATVDGYASTSVAIDVPNIGDTAAIYVSAKGTNYITSGTTNTSKAAYGYLAAPTISTQAISTTVVRFSWSNPTNVLSYQYYTSASGTIGPITLVSGTTTKDITVADAGNVTIYVQSIGLPYAPSNTWGTLYGTAYLGYSSVTANSIVGTPNTTTQVSFTWSGVNSDSYDYYTSYNSTVINTTNTSAVVSSGSANTSVTLYVKSKGNASYMPATTYSSGSGTSYAGTASISNLSATSLTTTTVRVSWNTISNVGSFSYRTNIDPTSRTLTNTTTSQDVSTSGIGGSVRFYISATGATNYMNMAETYVDGSSYGYWATPSLTYTSTSTTTFTVSWSAASGATYQYSTPTVTKTNTSSSSSQSITVSSAGGNATVTIYATGGVYAESSASITGYGYVGNASITTPTVSARTPSSVSFSWSGSNITKYYYSTNNANWTDNGTSTSAAFSASAGGTVTIYVKGDAAASYAPASNVSASGTAKSGFSGVTSLSGAGASYTTVTFSWTSSNAGSYNYYTSADSTVRNTTNTSITVSNGGTTGASVTFYIIGITNNSNYDTPSTYQQTSASGTTPDTTPNDFSFTATSGATRGQTYTSSVVTLGGMDSGQTVAVSVSGGTLYYSTDNSSFSSTSSSANISTNNIYIKASGTANSSYSGTTTVTVTYGGVQKSYTITSEAAPIINSPLTASPATVTVAWPGSSSTNMTATTTVSNSASYAITTNFQNTYSTPLSGGGHAWSMPNPTVIAANSSVTMTFAAALNYNNTNAYWEWALIASGHNGTYSTFRLNQGAPIDTTPDDFSFTSKLGSWVDAVHSYPIGLGVITVGGMNANTLVPVSVSGGKLFWASIPNPTQVNQLSSMTDGSTYLTTDENGRLYLKASGTASSSYSTTTSVVITVGGVQRSFNITTAYQVDTTPDNFSFTSSTGITSTNYNNNYSGDLTSIPGLGAYTLVPMSTSGGGAYWNTDGTGGIYDGSIGDFGTTGTATGNVITGAGGALYVKPIGLAPSGAGLSKTVTITIGGVSRTWTMSTSAATPPPPPVTPPPPAAVVPGPPGNMTATSPTANSVTISWTAPTSGGTPTWYDVWAYIGSTWTNIRNIVDYPGTSTVISGLTASTDYIFYMWANNAAGNHPSPVSVSKSTTAATFTTISVNGNTVGRSLTTMYSYSFACTITGYYQFDGSVGGTFDSYMYLLSASGTELTYDDDSGDGAASMFQYSCTAGTTYIVKVREYNYNNPATTAYLTITKIDSITATPPPGANDPLPPIA